MLPFLLFFGVLFSSCSRTGEKYSSHYQVSTVLNGTDVLSIVNTSDSEVCFLVRVGDAPVFEHEIPERIKALADDFPNESIERKAWRYVMMHADYFPSYSEDRDAHGPLIFFNSIGRGQCDDLAAVLAHVWRLLGLSARVRTLDGHVVPEVLVGDRWLMFDPSFQVYYLTRDGQIAGAEELSQQPDLITNPEERLPVQTFNNMGGRVLDSLRYSPFMAAYYSNGGRNEVSQWYDEALLLGEMKVCIPSGAMLDFPQWEAGVITQVNWYQEPSNSIPFIRLTFGDTGRQRVQMPYAFVAMDGTPNIELIMPDSSGVEPFFSVDTSIWVNAKPGDVMYYLLNGKLLGQREMHVTICRSDTASAKIRLLQAKGASLPLVWQKPNQRSNKYECCHAANLH